MPKRNAVQKRAREIQQAEGIAYHDALNRARAEAVPEPDTEEPPASAPAAVAYVLEPTAVEAQPGITAEELGVRALPADADAGRRAYAEAVWRPEADPAKPCRCSGQCSHGKPCPLADEGCEGRLVHVDRHPGSLWGVTTWWDTHECADCDERFEGEVELPALPWGEHRPNEGAGFTTVVYDGVRHPNFPGLDLDDEDELDPDAYPTPEEDYYDDEHAADEESAPLQQQDQEDEPDYLDHGPEDDVEPSEEPPEDYYDERPDEGELGTPSLVPALDPDPQPTAADWSPLDEGPRSW